MIILGKLIRSRDIKIDLAEIRPRAPVRQARCAGETGFRPKRQVTCYFVPCTFCLFVLYPPPSIIRGATKTTIPSASTSKLLTQVHDSRIRKQLQPSRSPQSQAMNVLTACRDTPKEPQLKTYVFADSSNRQAEEVNRYTVFLEHCQPPLGGQTFVFAHCPTRRSEVAGVPLHRAWVWP